MHSANLFWLMHSANFVWPMRSGSERCFWPGHLHRRQLSAGTLKLATLGGVGIWPQPRRVSSRSGAAGARLTREARGSKASDIKRPPTVGSENKEARTWMKLKSRSIVLPGFISSHRKVLLDGFFFLVRMGTSIMMHESTERNGALSKMAVNISWGPFCGHLKAGVHVQRPL